MATSLNATFSASFGSHPEFPHPPGASIAERFSADLKSDGWETDEIDNWRDCGWSVACRRGDARLEVVLAQVEPERKWMLQVAAASIPGFFGRLSGKKPSASSGEVTQLARDVSSVLKRLGAEGMRWRWDGAPDEAHSIAEP